MSLKIGAILFWAIIALHFAAAVLPIQNWPLTDYPMFSQTKAKFSEISKITLVNVFNGNQQEWSRSDYASVGYNSAMLQKFVNDPTNKVVIKFIKERVSLHETQGLTVPDAVIIRKTIYSLGPDNNLSSQSEDIESLSHDQLKN